MRLRTTHQYGGDPTCVGVPPLALPFTPTCVGGDLGAGPSFTMSGSLASSKNGVGAVLTLAKVYPERSQNAETQSCAKRSMLYDTTDTRRRDVSCTRLVLACLKLAQHSRCREAGACDNPGGYPEEYEPFLLLW